MSTTLPQFCALDPQKPVRVFSRDLPHWRQPGATYFVTFRLGDSIPLSRIRQWRAGTQSWYQGHALTPDLSPAEWQARYRAIALPDREQFERNERRKVQGELDQCHGSCALRGARIVDLLSQSLRHFDGTRYRCGDFVVMPNHVHWLLMPLPGHSLGTILAHLKGYSAGLVNKHLRRKGALWQRETYDRLVRDGRELIRTRAYIHDNPAKARLKAEGRIWRCSWLDEVVNFGPVD